MRSAADVSVKMKDDVEKDYRTVRLSMQSSPGVS